MSTTALHLELHKIIEQVEDEEVLKAVHTLLSSHLSPFAHSVKGTPLTKSDVDEMLKVSEEDIQYSRVIDHKALQQEIQSWRKK